MEDKNESKNKLLKKNKSYKLTRSTRLIIFSLLLLGVLGINITTGTLNTCSDSIKKNMKIDDKILGIFHMLYHIGSVISTLVFLILIKFDKRQKYIVCNFIATGLLISWFYATWNKFFLLTAQLLIGFSSTTIMVYTILWNDQFTIFKYKTVALTIVFLFRTLGTVLAMLLGYIYKHESYGDILFVNCFFLMATGIALYFFPEVYFKKDIILAKAFDHEKEYTKINYRDYCEKVEENKYESIFAERNSNNSIKGQPDHSLILGLFKNPVWHSNISASTIMVAVSSAFNLWAGEYFGSFSVDDSKGQHKHPHPHPHPHPHQHPHQHPHEHKNHIGKISLTIFMLLLGALGAVLINLYVTLGHGSYYSRSVSVFLFSFYIILFVIGNAITHFEQQALLTILSGAFMMFSNAIRPYFTGTNLSGATHNRKPFGVAMAVLINGLFGNAMGMFIFGILTKKFNRKKALEYYMYFLGVGLVAAFFAMYFKFKLYGNEDVKRQKYEEEMKKIEEEKKKEEEKNNDGGEESEEKESKEEKDEEKPPNSQKEEGDSDGQ